MLPEEAFIREHEGALGPGWRPSTPCTLCCPLVAFSGSGGRRVAPWAELCLRSPVARWPFSGPAAAPAFLLHLQNGSNEGSASQGHSEGEARAGE